MEEEEKTKTARKKTPSEACALRREAATLIEFSFFFAVDSSAFVEYKISKRWEVLN
jgi:hypothetical protein